ncbi:hypothetical protein FHS55_003427 [Angulomicrobium tetraedrale]|uniref:Peptidase C14 caspase domain-containing protein n=1 Tax=Ancylobacter tetraedralis TaxID=217068 RepID=A0A839ZDR5_9HYPH|nr:caspase family protein [Ancylobacter tetraedralis]MBB3772806.1 hypothetical protein [Ancylobacter tetraedralis]
MAKKTGKDGLVYAAERIGPQTHVFIVALGHYPNFLGGDNADLQAPLGQLASPPRSARLLADWYLKDYHYPPAPLGSLALLISEKEPEPYVTSTGAYMLRVPTYAAFEEAANAWIDRGMASEDDRMIFLFLGHGYGYGREASLLFADFDFRSRNKWEQALDLGLFHNGLQGCAAAEQIFMIDACRRPHGDQAEPDAAIGRSPIHPGKEGRKTFAKRRNAPLFFSTGDAEPARGRIDGASVFTEAFLRTMAGMGAHDDDGDWRVNNYTMLYALSHVSRRLTQQEFPEPQQPQGAQACMFDFHILTKPPVAPVYVVRADQLPCGPGTLHIAAGDKTQSRQCAPEELEVEVTLPLGQYDFSLMDSHGTERTATQSSRPTFKRARLI